MAATSPRGATISPRASAIAPRSFRRRAIGGIFRVYLENGVCDFYPEELDTEELMGAPSETAPLLGGRRQARP